MKLKISLLFFCILMVFQGIANTSFDSKMADRAQLIKEADSAKALISANRWGVLPEVTYLLGVFDNLVNTDNAIIDEYNLLQADYDKLTQTNEGIKADLSSAKTELGKYEELKPYIMYGGGAVALLFLLILLLLIIKSAKVSRLRKNTKELEKYRNAYKELKAETENHQADADKIVKMEAELKHMTETYNSKIEAEKKLREEQVSELKERYEKALEERKITENELKMSYEQRLAEEKEKFSSNVSDESAHVESLQRKLEDEKNTSEAHAATIIQLQEQIRNLNERLINAEKQEYREETAPNRENNDSETEIATLRQQVEEYQKILNEELEFRKDILKLIENLKKQ